MTAWLRLFFVGGLISYRALFNWIRPELYIPTMLGGPLFQILLFAYLGRFSGLEDDTFFVVGNAIQVSCMSGIYAATMAIANERQYQTLAPLLASPASRFAIFMGRSLPVLANGLLVSLWGFAVGWLLLDFDPPPSSLPRLVPVLVTSVAACTTFGLTLGSIGMRARDVFLISNLAYYLFWVFAGVNIPLEVLPEWMQAVGSAMPLTHGIEAARRLVDGAALGDVAGLVWRELVVAAGYGVLAFVLFRVFELEGRRRATLETF